MFVHKAVSGQLATYGSPRLLSRTAIVFKALALMSGYEINRWRANNKYASCWLEKCSTTE